MHTVVSRTGDITVNICFDSDRMDLLRVGILPVPERMEGQNLWVVIIMVMTIIGLWSKSNEGMCHCYN